MAGAASTVSPGLPGSDPLTDPLRVAAARRLLLEVSGPGAFDRLSALAARLLGVGHAKVTLFTDHDVVVGGHGLSAGAVGGPALLTGALSAITVRQGSSLSMCSAAEDERVAGLPAVTSGEVRSYLGAPLRAASGQVVGALTVYDTGPREWSADAGELLEQLAASVVAELELSAAQSAVGTSRAWLEVALEASSVGIWERDLRTGTIHWDQQRCAALLGVAPETVREDHVAGLAPGSTVLLYTDGLVERRDRDIDAGTQQLLEVLAECEGLPLGELCDRVLERMFLPTPRTTSPSSPSACIRTADRGGGRAARATLPAPLGVRGAAA